MKSPKRRRIALTILLVAILGSGAVVGWEVFRPRNDPKLLGKVPKELVLIPRSQFQGKAWVSMPWFGGKKLQYPTDTKMPVGWKDDPLSSGVLFWDDGSSSSAPVTSAVTLPPMSNLFSRYLAFFMTWTLATGERLEFPVDRYEQQVNLAYFDLPYVFGSKPLRCDIAFAKGIPSLPSTVRFPKFALELPALNKPAPKLQTIHVKQGGLDLTLTPKSWLGPTMVTYYTVTATGLKPGEHALLRGVPSPTHPALTMNPIWCRLSPGETSLIPVATTELVLGVWITQPEPLQIFVRPRKTTSPSPSGVSIKEVEYVDPTGQALAFGITVPAGSGRPVGFIRKNNEVDEKVAAIQIGDSWLGPAFNLKSLTYLERQLESFMPHAPGTYEGKVYRIKRKFNIEVTGLRMPEADIQRYVGKK